jgi:hypothetical protein
MMTIDNVATAPAVLPSSHARPASRHLIEEESEWRVRPQQVAADILEPHIVVSRWRAFSAQTTDAEPLGFVGQVVLDAGTTAGIADVLSFIGKGAVRVRGAQRVESRHQEGER